MPIPVYVSATAPVRPHSLTGPRLVVYPALQAVFDEFGCRLDVDLSMLMSSGDIILIGTGRFLSNLGLDTHAVFRKHAPKSAVDIFTVFPDCGFAFAPYSGWRIDFLLENFLDDTNELLTDLQHVGMLDLRWTTPQPAFLPLTKMMEYQTAFLKHAPESDIVNQLQEEIDKFWADRIPAAKPGH